MSSTTARPVPELLSLDVQGAARLLEQAARSQAPVSVVLTVSAEATVWPGSIAAVHQQQVHVTIKSSVLPRGAVGASCNVAAQVNGSRYYFTTIVDEIVEEEHQTMLIVAQPKMVQMAQRRRFVRAHLADTTNVTVCGGANLQCPHFSGLLLNVSRDGLACRVDRRDADRYAVDAEVGLTFTVGVGEPTYQLKAAIRAKTPAATSGQIILRLQFLRDEASTAQITRLDKALEAFL